MWRSYCIRRACGVRAVPVHIRAVHGYAVATHAGRSRPVALRYLVHLYRFVGIPFDHICTRAVIVAHTGVVIYIVVIDDGGLVYIAAVIFGASPVVHTVRLVHILRAYKYPPAVGAVIAHAYLCAGAHWRPSALVAAVAPVYPCGRPFVSRYPYPTVIGVISPAAIVVTGPSPRIFRYPGIAIVGHGPVAAAAIGAKIAALIRHPYIAILRIGYPLAVGRQLIIKILVRHRYILCLSPGRCAQDEEKAQERNAHNAIQ